MSKGLIVTIGLWYALLILLRFRWHAKYMFGTIADRWKDSVSNSNLSKTAFVWDAERLFYQYLAGFVLIFLALAAHQVLGPLGAIASPFVAYLHAQEFSIDPRLDILN